MVAANYPNGYDHRYDELMLRCLDINGYRKKASIEHFKSLFPGESHIAWYAHHVYKRVMKDLNVEDAYATMKREAIENIRLASEAALERGEGTGDWDPFLKITDRQLRMLGMIDDKGNPIQVNFGGQHIHSVSSAADVKARIGELENALGIGTSGNAGGIGAITQGQPIALIPAPQQANTGNGIPG